MRGRQKPLISTGVRRAGFLGTRLRIATVAFAVVVTLNAVHLVGCTPDPSAATPTPRPVQQHVLIDFPESLRTQDLTVNAFVEEVIQTCVHRDYEAFRLLWRVEEEPMSQQEFLRGWEAAEEVRIVQLQQWQTKKGELFYAARGLVKLNPNEVPKPELNVVLMIVQENGRWRLAKAPRLLDRKMQERADAATNGLVGSNGVVGSNGLPASTNGAGA